MPATSVTMPLACPFTVVIDRREQLPFPFAGLVADARDGRRPLVVPAVAGMLETGDYSIAGYEQSVAVERKSLADLFSTIGQGRRRFERELARLNAIQVAEVVVEADWEDVLIHPPEHSRLTPKTVFRSIVAWRQRFPRVGWWLMPTRRLAEVLTFRILERYWKDQQKAKSLSNVEAQRHE